MNEILDNSDKKKPGRKSKNEMHNLGNVQVLEHPNRTLPKLIEEVLEKGFQVQLSSNGYYIGGFYGINPRTDKEGFAFAQDTSEANALAFEDGKGYKHLIKNFEELVHFHSLVWSQFYKETAYRKADPRWLQYLLEMNAASISPITK
jgi:hypothetical protein